MYNNISIIIRTHNEERWIGHSIQSILDNIDDPEIIIVDDNSTDKTLQIVKSFKHSKYLERNKNYADIKIVSLEPNIYTPGLALNMGVKNCKNDFILIISAHCVLKDINVVSLKNELKENNKIKCIFGNQIPIWNGKKITKRYIWANFLENETITNMWSEGEERWFLHNALAFYPKKILLEYPFNEELVGKEDRYWAGYIIDNHIGNIKYNPLWLSCYHYYTDNGNTWKGIG